MHIAVSILIGYLLGSINPAFVIGKIKGFDIRKKGSGNAGASNAVITMGKAVGIISALLDIFKAFFAVHIVIWLFPSSIQAGNIAAISCILGHIFPIFMGFRGGKGLATLGGVILAFDYRVFLIMLLLEFVLALIVDYICIVPITASIVFPIIYVVMTHDKVGAALYALVSIVILLKHVENLIRIYHGTEAHFSFLWRRKQEIERLGREEDAK